MKIKRNCTEIWNDMAKIKERMFDILPRLLERKGVDFTYAIKEFVRLKKKHEKLDKEWRMV